MKCFEMVLAEVLEKNEKLKETKENK